LELIKKKD